MDDETVAMLQVTFIGYSFLAIGYYFLAQDLSKKPDIYERLARAVAPSIYENEDVKKGILLQVRLLPSFVCLTRPEQLFGGNRKDFSKTGRGNFRSELNILLCGDPGTSKSQLLQYVFHLIPR